MMAVIPVSPGEYDHEGIIALHGEDFTAPFREAERNIAEGNPDALLRPGVPWGSTWSARAYLDCFNQDNRYSVNEACGRTRAVPRSSYSARRSAPLAGRRNSPSAALPGAGLARQDTRMSKSKRLTAQITATRDARGSCFETMFSWLSGL